jgi:hypothetical protein
MGAPKGLEATAATWKEGESRGPAKMAESRRAEYRKRPLWSQEICVFHITNRFQTIRSVVYPLLRFHNQHFLDLDNSQTLIW